MVLKESLQNFHGYDPAVQFCEPHNDNIGRVGEWSAARRGVASNEALPVRATAFLSATLHTSMRHHPSLFFIFAVVSSVLAQNPKPVADRLVPQNTLFEEQYQSDLLSLPERATAFGGYRYNDNLSDL